MKTWELLLAVLFLYSSSCYAYFKLAGPYEFIIDDFRQCDDVGRNQFQLNFKIKKLNATTKVFYGNQSILTDISNKYVIAHTEAGIRYRTSAAQWTSGGWGQNALIVEGKDLCSDTRDNLWEFFEALCNAVQIPAQCPLPLGTYSTPIGMPLVFKFKRFPSLPYGRYKTEIALYSGDIRVGCAVMMVTIDEIATTLMIG